jgi:hypothetical protein
MNSDWGKMPSQVLAANVASIDARLSLLEHLCREGWNEEALALCCIDIETLGQRIAARRESHLQKKK